MSASDVWQIQNLSSQCRKVEKGSGGHCDLQSQASAHCSGASNGASRSR